MAEIRSILFARHLRGDPSAHILRYRNGQLGRHGPGLSFWFLPLSAGVAEVPMDDQELPFLFHERSSDFQDVTVQGVITYRLHDPVVASKRVDFTLDLESGAHKKKPLEQIAQLLTQLAQQFAWGYLATTPIRSLLTGGVSATRDRILDGLSADETLTEMGLRVVSVRVSSVAPTAEVERALQTPTRERIQQDADEATFQRRAIAVEKERAISENELQSQIELARREEQLIAQRGQNEARRVQDQAASQKIAAEGKADRTRIEAEAEAGQIRAVESARVEAERARMAIYETLPPQVVMGLAAQELAAKLQRIEHLNISPDMLSPLLANLAQAGAKKLEG